METETTNSLKTEVDENSNVQTGELVTTEEQNSVEPEKKVNWKFRIKLILYFIGFILAAILIVMLVNAYGIYRNAEKYKTAYDAAILEFNRCDDIQNTQQQRDVFVYCDTLKEKFKKVQR